MAKVYPASAKQNQPNLCSRAPANRGKDAVPARGRYPELVEGEGPGRAIRPHNIA